MKNLIWIIVAAVVAVGAYLVFSGKSVEEVVEGVSGASVKAPEALDSAAEAAGEAVDTTTETVEEVTDTATEAVEGATEEAVEATQDAVDEAVEGVTNQATEAAQEGVEQATQEVTDVATDTATDALSVDGFSMDKVSGMIDGSDLDGLKKTMLKGALKKAQDDPEMLKTVLGQVKSALGL